MAAVLLAAAVAVACTRRPSSTTAAVATQSDTSDLGPVAGAVPAEELDVPSPALGALVPYAPASAWRGTGVPPKEYSLFDVPERSPVLGYAALDRDACEEALRKRRVPFTRAEDTTGVRAPVRLNGPLHGVSIHSYLPPAMRSTAHADLIDCRLALSLDDFATSLEPRGIVEVVHVSAYRSKKEGGCTAKYAGEQHCAALAVDVTSFTKKDGTKLVVDRDFHGKIGALTCATPAKNELWEIACGAAGRQFQVVLTPNWNAEHRNHLHLELTVHDWVLAR